LKKILIVEDEIVIAEDIKHMVKSIGHTVVGNVYNGDKVSDKVASLSPDLVLLDINIRGSKNGIDVGHDLKEKHIPFVFITSYSDEETLADAKKTLPLGYLVKPFNIDQLKVLMEMAFFNLERQSRRNLPTEEEIHSKMNINVTKSEYQIIIEISNGHTYEEIAQRKFVSINTVKSHMRHIYSKFNVKNKVELLNLLGS